MGFLGRSYRTYALDFWGFGESGKKRETYAVQDFVGLVNQFMEQLGISQAPLVGHSMGGTVSLSMAIQYPQRVRKVVVVGSPIVGSSLAFPLKLAGYRGIAFLLFNMMWAFRLTMRIVDPFICRDPRFPDMMDKDLSRLTVESFLLSIASLRRTDLRPKLNEIKIPVMGIYGERDNIVHPRQWQPLLEGVPHAKIIRWEKAQHFVMLDKPQDFMESLKSFLDEESASQ
jgi:pimeloyl-ACP methyl ester carboxylesterase